MSPNYFNWTTALPQGVTLSGDLRSITSSQVAGVRAVINIKSSAIVTGSGT